MKRFLTIFLGLICIITASFCITACNTNTASNESNNCLVDLADCEIGYELPVYPNCEFDYKIDDECTIQINHMSAKLIQKNHINANDVVSGDYKPYVVTVCVRGQLLTPTSKTFDLRLKYEELTTLSITSTSTETGAIEWRQDIILHCNHIIYLHNIIYSL